MNNAIAALVSIISQAPADHATRARWLEWLWQAVDEDQMPYIELRYRLAVFAAMIAANILSPVS